MLISPYKFPTSSLKLKRFLRISIATVAFLTILVLLFGESLLEFAEVTTPSINIVTQLLYKSIFYCQILNRILRPYSECTTTKARSRQDQRDHKVISFSLFRRNNNLEEILKNYVPGIGANLRKVREIYPGWVVRIYTDLSAETSFLSGLKNETDVFICNVTNLPRIGNVTDIHEMVWRFLPIGDPTVTMFMVRDLDSLITPREQSAVAQWLDSTKIFHTMRDSPYHQQSVMGGLWGAKNYLLSTTMKLRLKNKFIEIGRDYFQTKNTDQDLLHKVLYRPYKHLFMVHDSYLCLSYYDSVPFPEERDHPMKFVGMKTYEFGNYDPFRCPVACRPTYGKNWTFC